MKRAWSRGEEREHGRMKVRFQERGGDYGMEGGVRCCEAGILGMHDVGQEDGKTGEG